MASKELVRCSKKKIDGELELYFPELVNSATIKEYYSKLKRHTKIDALNTLESTEERTSEVDRLENEMFLSSKVKIYHGSEGAEIRHIKRFEETCFLMDQVSNKSAETMTVLRFLQANETLSKKK